jgi:murein DD-endopeptidase MepM/ murein hydrolase activator NlpD
MRTRIAFLLAGLITVAAAIPDSKASPPPRSLRLSHGPMNRPVSASNRARQSRSVPNRPLSSFYRTNGARSPQMRTSSRPAATPFGQTGSSIRPTNQSARAIRPQFPVRAHSVTQQRRQVARAPARSQAAVNTARSHPGSVSPASRAARSNLTPRTTLSAAQAAQAQRTPSRGGGQLASPPAQRASSLNGPPLRGAMAAGGGSSGQAASSSAASPSNANSSGVAVTYTPDTSSSSSGDGPYTVTYQRRMDTSPNSGELYGIFPFKKDADKAVAAIQKWAAEIKAGNAQWGVTRSDWDIVKVNVSGGGTAAKGQASAASASQRSASADAAGITPPPTPQPQTARATSSYYLSQQPNFQWPLPRDFTRLSTHYGAMDASHDRPHKGIDIPAPAGTPVRAASAGRVVVSGTVNGFGNAVYVQLPSGLITIYGHLGRRGLPPVGMTVQPGDFLGVLGTREEGGHTTGPHLHFQVQEGVQRGTSTFDPLDFFPGETLSTPPRSTGTGIGSNVKAGG